MREQSNLKMKQSLLALKVIQKNKMTQCLKRVTLCGVNQRKKKNRNMCKATELLRNR